MADLIDARGFDLVPNIGRLQQQFAQTEALKQQTETQKQQTAQSAELQPLRVEQAQQNLDVGQQGITDSAAQMEQLQQQKQFMETELVPLLQSETVMTQLGTIDDVGQKRQFLRLEASKAAKAGNPVLAQNFNELSQESDEDLRLASTNFKDARRGAIEQGVLMGIPGASKLLPTAGASSKFQKGASFVTEEDGKDFIVSEVFNKRTGSTTLAKTPLTGKLQSRIGETAEQRQIREIETSRLKGLDKVEADISTATGKELATSAARFAVATIDEGRAAAKGIPILRRSLDLLDRVETGGVAARAILAGQNFLGITGADKSELNFLLGKNVLSQLKSIFGGAFSEKEGERLERIEAGFGKSPEGNRRVLSQMLKLAESSAQRAIKELIALGGTRNLRNAATIQETLEFVLGAEEAPTVEEAVQGRPTSIGEQFRQETETSALERKSLLPKTRGGRQQQTTETQEATRQDTLKELQRLRKAQGG